ncbi:MAG: hypothetical protein K2X47_18520 [Bdellovibrionales bacterium]|nr:hypothetical protein [Bdellovibrionales bacterium]
MWIQTAFIKLTAVSIITVACSAWAATPDLADQGMKWTQIELNNLSFPRGDNDLEGRPAALVIRKKLGEESATPAPSERIAGILLETPVWSTNGQRSYKMKMDDGSIRTIEFTEYQIIELWSSL